MSLTKQIVYLPVNGNQEKYVVSDNDSGYFNGVIEQEGYFFTSKQLNEYTANVVRQALETAAKTRRNGFYDSTKDEQSITNTFEESYKKFEV